MGGGSSQLKENLRECFLCRFVTDEDWPQFQALFQQHANVSTGIDVVSHRFIIVIDGEMAVCGKTSKGLPSDKNDLDWYDHNHPEISGFHVDGELAVFSKFNVSYFFGLENSSKDAVLYDDIEISIVPRLKSKDKKLVFMSVTKEAIAEFIAAHEYLKPIASMLDIKLSTLIVNNPLFEGLTESQIDSLSPLLRLVTISEQNILLKENEPASDIDGGLMAILLYGTLVELPPDICPEDKNLSSQSLHQRESTPVKTSATMKGSNDPSAVSSEITDMGKILPVGSCIGTELAVFDKAIATTTVIAASRSVVGLLGRQTIFKLASLGSPVAKTIYTNLVLSKLQPIRQKLPIFRDLSDEDFRRFAPLVAIQSFGTGKVIFKDGDVADKFYIVISGLVRVANTGESSESSPIGPGRSFGEVSLVTSSTRTSTVTTLSPTVLMAIDDKTFRLIFDQQKEHLCVSNLRQFGDTVELHFILRHQQGYAAFLDFLKLEFSTDSLLFWCSVDRFEELCDRWEAGSADSKTMSPIIKRIMHEITSAIMKTFIFDGSPNQINCSGKLRKETEADFQRITSGATTSADGEDSPTYRTLFTKTKNETYGLLKVDNYKRWRETAAFNAYMAEFQIKK